LSARVTLNLVTEPASNVKRFVCHRRIDAPLAVARPRKSDDADRVMNVRRITKGDFDRIVEVIDHWWGGPISTFAHPIFFYELGEEALVVEQGSDMIGFLLGFLVAGSRAGSERRAAARTGYVHLVGIHPDYRRRGVGRLLYDRFTQECREAQCVRMKAITTPGNEGSIRFHLALGWNVHEVDDYAGLGRRRIVFTKDLVSSG
jgi:GNAT superfamily N-acetyltransferase